MSIAKGTRSKLSYLQEVAYATTVTGTPPYTGISFRNETMDENINTIRSPEIRPDRAVASVRGGNVATGGNIVTDFAVGRHMLFIKHLLGTPEANAVSVTADASTDKITETSHIRQNGDALLLGGTAAPTGLVLGHVYYVVNVEADHYKLATTPLGTAIDLTGVGTAVTITPVFPKAQHSPAALANGAVVRGEYYTYTTSAVSRLFLCRKGGTVVDATQLTISAAGASQTIDGCIFYCVGVAASYVIDEFTLVGGPAFPVQGLAIEKQVLGGNVNLYVLFRGCRINTMALTVPQEGIVDSTWSIVGKDVDSNKSAAFSGSAPLPGEDPVAGFETFVSINSSQTTAPISQATLQITNQVDEKTFVIGERYRRDIPEGTRAGSGKITTFFEDRTEYDIFDQETKVGVDISFDHNGRIGTFSFPETKLTGTGTPKTSGMGPVTADYELTAFKETSTDEIKYVARIPVAIA